MSDPNQDPTAGNPKEQPERQFQLRKIYTKDISFESPNAPGIFSKPVNPSVNMNLATSSLDLSSNEYEVTIKLNLTATHQEDTIFLVEMEQSGIFLIENIDENRLAYLLAVNCPDILFPYARQIVSDMVVSGGYPPLLLAPFNFAALYQQHLQKEKTSSTESETTH